MPCSAIKPCSPITARRDNDAEMRRHGDAAMDAPEATPFLNQNAEAASVSARRRVAASPRPAKIMVRVPNWVGDAVMAVPALRELRRIFVDAQITLVARPWVAGLFEGEGLADDWIAVNDTRGWLQSTRQFIQTAQRLQSERFDFAVLLQNAFGAALAARLGGARQIAGYPTDGRRALLHHAIAF